jgi:hypothetical protein
MDQHKMFSFLIITGTVFILFFIIGALDYFRRRRSSYEIESTAKRLKLRDRGEVGPVIEKGEEHWLSHTFCRTLIRVGITEDGEAVHYCWKCELVFNEDGGDDFNPDPDGKEPAQVPEKAKVIYLRPKKAA